MTDSMPRIDDALIELLTHLSAMPPDSARLTDALRQCAGGSEIGTRDQARNAVSRLGRQLSTFSDGSIDLLQNKGRLGIFATPTCQALRASLVKINESRAAASEQALLAAQLEWLQLSSCLDTDPLRIGAYQAHAERLLSSAVILMVRNFPWIDCKLELESARERHDKYKGKLRERFDNGDFDYMLVPRESEQSHLDTVYTYSFRVIGHPSELDELTGSHNTVHIRRLRDLLRVKRLIVGPEGSSSRIRLRDVMLEVQVDIEDGTIELLEQGNPNLMRITAETGQGIAVMSDEYTTVGNSGTSFPLLVRGPDGDRAIPCSVEMCLLKRESAVDPRHRAFDFVMQRLIAQEASRDRSAAQS